MKIFAFVDLHGDFSELNRIIKKIKKEKPAYIICGGDLSIFGSHLELLSKKLDSLGIPVFMLHGNHEDEDEIKAVAKHMEHIRNMHGRYQTHGKYLFMGYGGGGFALRNPNFEKKTAKKFKAEIKKHRQKHKNAKLIFFTHGPPYNTTLDKVHGSSVGCKSLRKFIKEVQPDLVICGHLHENAGKTDKIGKSRLVNPGWKGKMFEI